ncbi:probable LRR receptor-like serine/threonine-protein kinase At1g56140 isoform X2 [Sesamum indicum]|uniref:non-specific serine/threonine protein kinase n=1 Tax=Sesamum indicum TaxID=4182 RepID=A0A6I9SHT1_SESIN|nr:probable LRR receptor-like serine/threonine-protein kinase At1g56140 isoform X2 [Sesamum indicum]
MEEIDIYLLPSPQSCTELTSVHPSYNLEMAAAAPPMRQTSRRRLLVLCCVVAFGLLMDTAGAQTRTTNATATTHPLEARALNAMFRRWGISATNNWNISGELCSGVAIDDTEVITLNPGIKCDCSYNNGSTCHITALRVQALNVSGPIPDELWSLTYMDDLNLGVNYLTGPVPASIGNLSRMQYLNFGANALSGVIPREIGLLTDLRSLSFNTNNFSGPLPSELGNLSRLAQIYIDSSGVRGPIPPTFANLQSLERVWASDTELTGQISFIGNWSNLIQLKLQGNLFEGPIPPSFSGLTSLNDLRISELSNGISSLDFLRNMTSLATLVLRNNNISGSIPSFLGELPRLALVDLSFNNLMGTIPNSLFNHGVLTNLYLGNNRLTGALPLQKSPSIKNIDLSYNELSGSFPSWVGEQNLQLNLVVNNFTTGNSNGSALPSGLNCLQRNFPCHRGSPIYSSFAINCGGMQIRSSDKIIYDMDNDPLGPATHYMTPTGRWAVSNVGLPVDGDSPQYQSSTSSQFTNTSDPGLFQTARISAGSLRYYGLGLENGNYTVRLLFAETIILSTWRRRSRGSRVFDIYVQGNLEVKDFDILREANGISFRAVVREFNVQVLENYIEIHLFWAGKGTCCSPAYGTYGPLISAISVTPDFVPSVSNNPPGGNKKRTGLIVGIIVAVAVIVAILLSIVAGTCYIFQRRKRQKKLEDKELLGLDVRPYTFSYTELKTATDDFNLANKLGEGGFGPVYKGTLEDGRVVAVKQLSVASRQGKTQFLAEIATISAVQHRNLVKLYGCCIEGDKRLLVYEYLENKSLDQLLFGTESKYLYLDCTTRYNICLGVARGLTYLHEESRLRIVHRDVKASNILLDSDLTPKISDFGLAKLYDDDKTHISTRVAGTIGYLAPEYAMRGRLTEKADIFSFGVVALEIISGRPNYDPSFQHEMRYLLGWAWNLHENDREIELVDPTLPPQYDANAVKKIIHVALLCTQASPALRPSMSRVVAMLTGDVQVSSVTSRPGYLTDWKFTDATTFATDAESSTSKANIGYMNSTTSATMIADGSTPTTDLSYMNSTTSGGSQRWIQDCV